MNHDRARQENIRTLVAAGCPDWKRAYAGVCQRMRCEVETVSSGFEALARLRQGRFDLVIGHASMGDLSPFELNLYVRDFARDHTVVVLAGQDPEALPEAVGGHAKLHATRSGREALEALTGIIASMRGVVRHLDRPHRTPADEVAVPA